MGDKLIICAYAGMSMKEAQAHKPRVVVLGPGNKIERITSTPGSK